MQVLTFLTLLLLGTACDGSVKKEMPKEKEHPNLIKTPGNGNVQAALKDKEGNLWFGTSDDGLYRYDGKSFRQFLMADGLPSNSINDLLEDKEGKIWIGTKAGVGLYDPSASLGTGGKMVTEIVIPLPKNLPPNKNKLQQTQKVYDIMQDKAGKLWFVTIDGVYIYDGKSFTLFPIDDAPNSFLGSHDKVERILEDKDGNIWFGGRTNEGVFRYDPSATHRTGGKAVTHFKLKELTLQFESKQVSHSWGWPQLQDKNGDIWFSNWAGAYRYDGKSFTSFTKSDGIPGQNGLVAKIIEDKNGNLWFGGEGGLSRYDPSATLRTGGKSFTGFQDGLINPWIWTILEDKSGNLWVGTRETGLYLFDGKTFISYSEDKKLSATD